MTDDFGPEEPQDYGDLIAVPGFQSGGVVQRTGIALVHEGEYILPSPGSEATITTDGDSSRTGQVVNYYFPVEIRVIGSPSREYMRACAQFVYDELLSISRTH